MLKYISEVLRFLSITIGFCIFPVLVLAQHSSLNDIIDRKIASLTLAEKAGQLFIIGFPQTKTDEALESFITTYKPGSFLLFKKNIVSLDQVKQFNADLYHLAYKASGLPPLIAVDQEGGAVSRLPISPAQPNALSIGQTQSPLLAEGMGYQTGLFLREAGFNMNLAPVLDVSDVHTGSFIGVRSFGADPNIVKELGVAYSKGLLRSRVIPTGKHFPGTGNVKEDPHQVIVTNSTSISTMRKKDLVPYAGYAALGPQVAVMLSHSIYPSLDPNQEPASFSSRISKDLLRNELKYQGLVITDDLQMKGSKQLLRPEMAALRSLKAGADMVMLTWSFPDQEKAIRLVQEAVKKGDLSQEDLNAKLRRILTVKAFANVYRKDPNMPALTMHGALSSLSYKQIEGSILTTNLSSFLPAKSDAENDFKIDSKRAPAAALKQVCIVSTSKGFLTGFSSATHLRVQSMQLNKDSSSRDVSAWAHNKDCPLLILTVTGSNTAKILRALDSRLKRKTIVINMSSPGLVDDKIEYKKLVQLSFNHQDSGKKIAEELNQLL